MFIGKGHFLCVRKGSKAACDLPEIRLKVLCFQVLVEYGAGLCYNSEKPEMIPEFIDGRFL